MEFAQNFARELRAGDVIYLSGELGAGKTVFARGLCRGLGFAGGVTSPTFTLVNVYEGGRLPVFHFDLYRLGGAADLESIGYDEYFDAGGVCVVEWPERAMKASAFFKWLVTLTTCAENENAREITIRENTGR
ncbi:MAG: tRNA (adenosine(37)-N6)-threonylcarbamoyltransferase complex ATPase subunit type 1 TsaE [Defluviitaleaceae bacterium]|nr:tRNA (adenosine(37)-N6)-threonylcarbamoyltransferase complex ATPase subunit type 1 TsaE [Defluviitaleaceae bacterium]